MSRFRDATDSRSQLGQWGDLAQRSRGPRRGRVGLKVDARERIPSTIDSPVHGRRARVALVVSVLLTAALYAIPDPYGFYASYPFLLLSTLAHELGHGLAGVLVGGDFHRFVMFTDGSGHALVTGDLGRLAQAAVAAGGLVGPAVIAGLCFALARRGRAAKLTFIVFAALLGLALVLVVRNVFGLVFVSVVAAGCAAIGLRANGHVAQVSLLFVAVQLALSVFSRGDYLFTEVATTGVGAAPSDVANMAHALFLPYWFWGALCGLFSVMVLAAGLAFFLRPFGPRRLSR